MIPLDRLQSALEGRFLIERELGRGGMSVVYQAYDLEERRQVALKVLPPELAASVGGERFLREIEIGKTLSHPHILPIYNSGQTDDLLYYTMPVAEGETLRERLSLEKQLPLDEALAIAREVASALAYAHRHEVVHRDIKPSNILLTEGGAVVMDFGIARAVDPEGEKRLTKTGLAMGTPAYMSPEQAASGERVDGRSDQYSLACVLYEMLAGHTPFQGSGVQVVLTRHAKDPVPPLSSARSTVSVPIEAVVHKALSKVPADRFRSAEMFADALRMAEQGVAPHGVTPEEVTPAGTWYAMTVWGEMGRRRVYQVAASYIVVAWALVQVAEATFDPIGIPIVARTWLTWAAIAGFPVALLLAWLYELTPRGIRRTHPVDITPAAGSRAPGQPRLALTLGVLAVGTAGVGAYVAGRASVPATPRAVVDGPAWFTDLSTVKPRDLALYNQVAVMPFRGRALDPRIRDLREGLVDLLDVAFHGALTRDWNAGTLAQLRTEIDPDPSADPSPDQARQIAVRVGAGRLVEGWIHGTPEDLTISATIRRTSTGTVLGRESLTGPLADLNTLVNRLALQLFLAQFGWVDEMTHRDVAEAAPEALETLLEGVREWMRDPGVDSGGGRDHLRLAVEFDSSFALAAYMNWHSTGQVEPVWPLRDELSDVSRTILHAYVGEDWPRPRSSVAERIRDAELALERYPDQPLLLRRLSLDYYWFGFYVALTRDEAVMRARNLARREWELREGEEGVGWIFTLTASGYRRDTTGLAQLARDYLEEWENDPYPKWLVGIMLPDTALAAEARAEGVYEQRVPGMFDWYNVQEGRPRPDPLADLERAIEVFSRRVRTTREQTLVLHRRLELAVYRGRPDEAIRLLDTLSRVDPEHIHWRARSRDAPEFYFTLPITHALVEDGWEEAVPWAIGELHGRNPALSHIPAGDRACMAAIGEVALGRVEEAAARIPRIREAQDDNAHARVCPAMLEALVAHETSGPGLPDAIRRLDDLLRSGAQMGILGDGANLYLARMLAARGELELAVAALKRRPYRGRSLHIIAPYARLEGRLLALAGDTLGAVRAYEHYLALRQKPGAALLPEKEAVERELAAILAANPGLEIEAAGSTDGGG